MAYSDIDSGKVLNKEGLLELCNQIKTEIANNSSGGGASYTAGNGISISNDVISVKQPVNDTANLLLLILKNGCFTTGLTDLNNTIQKSPSNKNDCIDAFLKGYIVNVQASITITQSDLGLSSNIRHINLWNARNDKTWITTASNNVSSVSLVAGRFYFYDNSILYEWRNPVDIWSQLPLYTPDNTFSTIGAYLKTLAGRVPAPSTTDGTYMLKCVVSSGTPTYSWESITVGGSY